MAKITTKHTQFTMPIELQFLAIPTTWSPRNNKDGERILFPSVSQHAERRLARIDDPEEIRKQFFKMTFEEDSACDFLNGVGVWSAIEDERAIDRPGVREMLLRGAFGYRWLSGRAIVATLESLSDEQKYWRELCRNRAKLRAAFGPPPPTNSASGLKDWFALESQFGNTLQVHLEWRGRHPHAIIQPVTARELLTALAWIDLVTGAECKVCQNPNCGVEYTRGGRKYCSWQCEHANSVRAWRIRKREAEKEANGKAKSARKSLR
jgi:hypothetical protein